MCDFRFELIFVFSSLEEKVIPNPQQKNEHPPPSAYGVSKELGSSTTHLTRHVVETKATSRYPERKETDDTL